MNAWLSKIVAAGALALAAPHVAASEPFPTRPIRILVNTAPGGLTDVTTRVLAQHMGEYLKQSIVVENRAGADGLIGIRAAKGAPADGYTILAAAGTIAQQQAMRKDAGYDLQKDFTGIGLLSRSPSVMVIGAGQPDRTLADFLARAKANPGKLSYASAGVGTVPHFITERFLRAAGIKVNHVPYKGNGPAAADVMSGRVDMILEGYGSASARIKSGMVRVLGITSTVRAPALPDVPTFAEQGITNFSAYTWLCLVAPAGTSKDVVQRLADALRSAKSNASVQQRFRDDGTEDMDMSPEQFNQFLAREVVQSQKLVSELGLDKQ